MNLEYNFTVKTSEVTSAFKQAEDSSAADIHIDKKFDWLRFEVSFNEDSDLIVVPKIQSIEYLNSKTIIKTNTLDLLVTNILVDGAPYYHKLNVVSEKVYDKDTFIIDMNIEDVVEFENEFYTNSAIYTFNSATDYVYTSKVINVNSLTFSYKANGVVVEAPKDSYVKIKETLFKPQIINPYSFYIPSFYIQKPDNSFIACIESDIKVFESKLNSFNGDYLKYKVEDSSVTEVLSDFNISLKRDFKDEVLKYRISSHCFNIFKDVEYFKVEDDGSIVESNSNDYLFKIERLVDIEKIEITTNTYKELNPKYKNILGNFINSYKEENKEINNFGTIYNRVYYPVFVYNYITKETQKSILYTPLSFENTSRLLVKSLKSDATLVRSLPPLSTGSTVSIDYTSFESVNYFIDKAQKLSQGTEVYGY